MRGSDSPFPPSQKPSVIFGRPLKLRLPSFFTSSMTITSIPIHTFTTAIINSVFGHTVTHTHTHTADPSSWATPTGKMLLMMRWKTKCKQMTLLKMPVVEKEKHQRERATPPTWTSYWEWDSRRIARKSLSWCIFYVFSQIENVVFNWTPSFFFAEKRHCLVLVMSASKPRSTGSSRTKTIPSWMCTINGNI